MTKQNKKPTEVFTQLYDLLKPLEPGERSLIVKAVFTMLGDPSPVAAGAGSPADKGGAGSDFGGGGADPGRPVPAQAWMKQNEITEEIISQAFHFENGKAEVIASDVPGQGKRPKTLSAYIIAGLSSFLSDGSGKVEDKDARSLCIKLGCYDSANHASIIKAMGNEMTGSKNTGWTLTAPGKKRAANLLKEMTKSNS
jgi:hypothetical protein